MDANNLPTRTSVKRAVATRQRIHRASLMSNEMAVLIAATVISIPLSSWLVPELCWVMPVALLFGCCLLYWNSRFDPALRERVIQELMPSWRHSAQLLEELESAHFDRGAQQLAELDLKFDNLLAILDRRYSRNEYTYMRYVAAGQEVYLQVCDGLRHAADHRLSISTINRRVLLGQIEDVRDGPASAVEHELAALERHLTLLDDADSRVAGILGDNEVLLTALDETTTSLAAAQTDSRLARTDTDTAIAELERLVRQTASRTHRGSYQGIGSSPKRLANK